MNDSLPQLPEYDPAANLWDRIEANLQADELFNRLSQELPLHEPNPDLWPSIEATLSVNANASIRPLWPDVRFQWAGLAAIITLLIIGMWAIWPSETPEKVHIEYATELTKPASSNKPVSASRSATTTQTEAIIEKRCAQQKAICQRPEVHELRKQLTSLTLKQQRLEQEREIFGDDPTLLRAQTKLETQRAEVTKELLTLLES